MTVERPFPVMSIAQCNALMTAPGAKFEMEEKTINGVRLRTYKNAPATLRDVVTNGRAFGTREFLVHEGDRVTFAAFHRAVAAFAERLFIDASGAASTTPAR